MKIISNKLTLPAKLILLAKAFMILSIGFLFQFKGFIFVLCILLLGFFFAFLGVKLEEIGVDKKGSIFIRNFTHIRTLSSKNINKIKVNFAFSTLFIDKENGKFDKHYFLLPFKKSLELQFSKSERMIEKELWEQLKLED